jgi:hypothetical protein
MGRTGWPDWTTTPSATTHRRLRPRAPRRTAGRGTQPGLRATGGPPAVSGPKAELDIGADKRTSALTGAVSGPKAELDIGADKRTST